MTQFWRALRNSKFTSITLNISRRPLRLTMSLLLFGTFFVGSKPTSAMPQSAIPQFTMPQFTMPPSATKRFEYSSQTGFQRSYDVEISCEKSAHLSGHHIDWRWNDLVTGERRFHKVVEARHHAFVSFVSRGVLIRNSRRLMLIDGDKEWSICELNYGGWMTAGSWITACNNKILVGDVENKQIKIFVDDGEGFKETGHFVMPSEMKDDDFYHLFDGGAYLAWLSRTNEILTLVDLDTFVPFEFEHRFKEIEGLTANVKVTFADNYLIAYDQKNGGVNVIDLNSRQSMAFKTTREMRLGKCAGLNSKVAILFEDWGDASGCRSCLTILDFERQIVINEKQQLPLRAVAVDWSNENEIFIVDNFGRRAKIDLAKSNMELLYDENRVLPTRILGEYSNFAGQRRLVVNCDNGVFRFNSDLTEPVCLTGSDFPSSKGFCQNWRMFLDNKKPEASLVSEYYSVQFNPADESTSAGIFVGDELEALCSSRPWWRPSVISHDRKFLIISESNGQPVIFDWKSGEEEPVTFPGLNLADVSLGCAAASKNKESFAATFEDLTLDEDEYGYDETYRLIFFNKTTREQVLKPIGEEVSYLDVVMDFSDDGRELAVCTPYLTHRPASVLLYTLNPDREPIKCDVGGLKIRQVRFFGADSIFSVTEDGEFVVFRRSTGDLVVKQDLDLGAIQDFYFSDDGKRLYVIDLTSRLTMFEISE